MTTNLFKKILTLLLLISHFSLASEILNDEYSNELWNGNASVYSDCSSADFDINKIPEENQFLKHSENYFRFNPSYCQHWIKVDLTSSENATFIADLQSSKLDLYQFILSSKDEKLYSDLFGNLSNHDNSTNKFQHPTFEFRLEKDNDYSLYISIKTSIHLSLPFLTIKAKSIQQKDATSQYMKQFWLYGYHSMAMLICIGLFIRIRHKIHFYYLLFMFFNLIWYTTEHGYGVKYLWSSYPNFQRISMDFSSVGILFSLLLFANGYLENYSKFSKTITKILTVIGIVFLVSYFSLYFFPDASFIYEGINKLGGHDLYLLTINFFVLALTVVRMKTHPSRGIPFFFGFLPVIIITSLYLVMLNTNSFSYTSFKNLAYFTVTWEVTVFTFLLLREIEKIHKLQPILLQQIQNAKNEISLNENLLKSSSELNLNQGKSEASYLMQRDLHDGPAQTLQSLRYILLSGSLTQDKVEVLTKGLKRATDELSQIYKSSQNADLTKENFFYVLNKHLHNIQTTWGCQVHLLNEEKIANVFCQTSIIRVLQEIISNAVKHSQATEIWIEFYKKDKRMHLQLTCNGSTFIYKKALAANKGNGLMNIRNRIKEQSLDYSVDINEDNYMVHIICER